MQYDLDAIEEACRIHLIRVFKRTGDMLELDLGAGAVMVLVNDADVDDCSCFFRGNIYDHIHNNYPFSQVDPEGNLLYGFEMGLVDVVEALSKGEVLVAEVHRPPYPIERRLMYCRCDTLTKRLLEGEEIRVRRATLVQA